MKIVKPLAFDKKHYDQTGLYLNLFIKNLDWSPTQATNKALWTTQKRCSRRH